jgi:endoglucanase
MKEALVIAALAATGCASTSLSVRVQGATLVDGGGKPLRLVGVDYSGTEYACVQGNGIFDGPSDARMVDAIAAWRANAVRVPLNEDCWLALNDVPAAFAGERYRRAIADFVKRLHAKGLYAILDLHWSAPGAAKATKMQPMADRSHALDFWRSVAATFKDDPAVIFDLYNEPFLSASTIEGDPWECWKSGCLVTFEGATYQSAGMQELVDAVRSTGASNALMLGGLAYANDVSGWLTHMPHDPKRALLASFHVYNFNACVTSSCWDAQVKPILAAAPVVTGEIGEDDCGHAFIDHYMPWADAAGISYLAWTWNPWGSDEACGRDKIALIRDWSGTPSAYGAGFRAHIMNESMQHEDAKAQRIKR